MFRCFAIQGRNGPSERNGVSDEGLESSLPQPSYGWIGGGFRRQYSHTQFSPSLILPLVLMLMLLSIFLFGEPALNQPIYLAFYS